MNDSKPPLQRLLFECDGPRWKILPQESRAEILEVLSLFLLDVLERYDNASVTTETTAEDNHD